MIDITINLKFYLGAYSISFTKDFKLPYGPFIGLSILDSNEGYDSLIEFKNDDYTRTSIYYSVKDGKYFIDVHNKYPMRVSDEVVDYDLSLYSKLNWTNTTDDSITIKKLSKR